HSQFFKPSRTHGADTRIIPNVRASASVLTQLKIIDVRRLSVLPHEDEFVLASIEAPHPGVGLIPDAQVLELAIDLAAGRQHLAHMPPVHANLVDGAVGGVLDQEAENGLQKGSKFRLAHLAAAHRKIAMPNAAKTA